MLVPGRADPGPSQDWDLLVQGVGCSGARRRRGVITLADAPFWTRCFDFPISSAHPPGRQWNSKTFRLFLDVTRQFSSFPLASLPPSSYSDSFVCRYSFVKKSPRKSVRFPPSFLTFNIPRPRQNRPPRERNHRNNTITSTSTSPISHASTEPRAASPSRR